MNRMDRRDLGRGVTDKRMDQQTDRPSYRDARTHPKTKPTPASHVRDVNKCIDLTLYVISLIYPININET